MWSSSSLPGSMVLYHSICCYNGPVLPVPGPWFNIKMSSYQYRKSHCGDKTVVRSSYLHNGISYTGKMASLYWISPQVPIKPIQLTTSEVKQCWSIPATGWNINSSISGSRWSWFGDFRYHLIIRSCKVSKTWDWVIQLLWYTWYMVGAMPASLPSPLHNFETIWAIWWPIMQVWGFVRHYYKICHQTDCNLNYDENGQEFRLSVTLWWTPGLKWILKLILAWTQCECTFKYITYTAVHRKQSFHMAETAWQQPH